MKKRYWLIPLVILLCGYGVFYLIQNFNGMSSIQLGSLLVEMRTATLFLILLGIVIVLYLSLSAALSLITLRYRLKRKRANRELSRGLTALAEGYWQKAEKLLLNQIDHSDTPLINHLAAARAAHMGNDFERRDELLKQAITRDPKSMVAIGVSQADMQIASEQYTQALATLQHLRQRDSKNPYVLKLYARVLLQQKHWDELLELLPSILRHKSFRAEDMQRVQHDTLKGIFERQIELGGSQKLKEVWRKLPNIVREQQAAIDIYASLLHQSNEHEQCIALIESSLNKQWSNQLVDLYSRVEHSDLGKAYKKAETWLGEQPNNPYVLLLLARLNKQQQLWGLAKHYYEASLNQAPSTCGYLELAELLEELNDEQGALLSYRTGLRYSARHKAEHLHLNT